MKKEVIVRLHASFEQLVRHDETGDEFWLARDLQDLLGYARWENFQGVVLRAEQLARNGVAEGRIARSCRTVSIGSGALRQLVDYRLDRNAVELLSVLATSFKLNGYFLARNEAVILGLLAKWADRRELAVQPQFRLEDSVFDLMIGNSILVEFDEPHHESSRQRRIDDTKRSVAQCAGYAVVRLGLSCDVVDAILAIEPLLEAQSAEVRNEADLILLQARLAAKANDFANEITNFNIKKDGLRSEPAITVEHVKNNRDVRGLLTQRGIEPESLPAAEDIKKIERRVQSETKKLPKARKAAAAKRNTPKA